MNRNTKIALGCGGAGCLGLILLVIVAWCLWSPAIPCAGVSSYNSKPQFQLQPEYQPEFKLFNSNLKLQLKLKQQHVELLFDDV